MQFIVRHDATQGVAGIEPQNMNMAMGGGTPGDAVKQEDLQPLIEAARSNGIANDHIDSVVVPSTAFSTPFGPGVGVLVLQLEKADLKHRVKIANSVTNTAEDHGLTFDQIGVAYIVDDCVSLDHQAIADAAEDAHDQAELMAEVMGLTLGELIAVDKQPSYQGYGGASGSACGTIPTIESAKETYFSSFDPNGKAEQEIYEYLTVTYAIG
jgi:hypothetical protein